MRSNTSKYLSRQKIQFLLNQQEEVKANLKQIETQLQQTQKNYLQSTWKNGNILVGWYYGSRDPQNNDLLLTFPKDKIFSMSSVTSNVSKQLQKSGFLDFNFHIQNRLSLDQKKKKKKQYNINKNRKKQSLKQIPEN